MYSFDSLRTILCRLTSDTTTFSNLNQRVLYSPGVHWWISREGAAKTGQLSGISLTCHLTTTGMTQCELHVVNRL